MFRTFFFRNYFQKEFFTGTAKCFNSTVGFIGLGNMGMNMTQNLLNKGETMVVYDANTTPLKQLSDKRNVTIVNNLRDVARKSKYIITMLPDDDSVMSVYTNDNGILKNCQQENAIFIDSSTVDPKVSKEIWYLAKEKGYLFLDAPVSGGVVGAGAATLTFMVGGCKTIPRDVETLLLKMGSRIIHCGGSGMGQAAKLCNNMLLGTTMVAVAETLNLGIRFGLDAKILTSIINTSSGRCWSSEVNLPVPGIIENVPSNREYKGGFKTNLLLKDMKLALKLAQQTDSSVSLAKQALEMYNNAATEKGVGESDFSIIYKTISSNERN